MTALAASAVPLLKEFGGQEPRRVSVEHRRTRRTPSNTVEHGELRWQVSHEKMGDGAKHGNTEYVCTYNI